MGIYDNRARRTVQDDLTAIIGDAPTTITVERQVHADKMRDKTTATYGPYSQARIEQFKATRSAVTFDEKGTAASAAFVLIALGIPRYQDDDKKVPTFQIEDVVIDSDDNRYRVTSPARWLGEAVEVNIELRG